VSYVLEGSVRCDAGRCESPRSSSKLTDRRICGQTATNGRFKSLSVQSEVAADRARPCQRTLTGRIRCSCMSASNSEA
jgi:hypothetical protein